MSFPDRPDCTVPLSDFRCEAITKYQPFVGAALWAKEPHRCVRKAVAGRDGRSVCANHNRAKGPLSYWDGKSLDSFKHRKVNRRDSRKNSVVTGRQEDLKITPEEGEGAS